MATWLRLVPKTAAMCAAMGLAGASSMGLTAAAWAEPAAEATPAAPEAGAAAASAAAPAPAEAQATTKPDALGALVRAKLDVVAPKLDDAGAADVAALKAFYAARNDEPMWVSGDQLGDKAKAVITELKAAGDWGLDADAFDLPDAAASALSKEQAAEAEAKLSLATLLYARHARGGRIPEPAKQLSSYLDRMPQLIDPKVVIEQIAASSTPEAVLRGFNPKHPQFEKLRQKYLELKASAQTAAATVKIPAGAKLVPGQKHVNVALLRQRLKVPVPAGASGAPGDETLYDAELAAAVKAFQSEKGFRPDGIVGSATRNALNEVELPSPARLLANMEEWRWMPDDLGDFYVWVNIPEFLVRVVKDGQIIHEERVVTGLPDKQTPVFSANMELVTFHPVWNVPESIKVRELYPSLARGGNPIQRQGLRLTRNGRPIDPRSVDWGSTDIRQFDIQQPSGSSNVLGVVKLSFPNKHTVYMHDTSSKALFDEPSRAFSHGCVRVRNPLKLAEIVLAKDKGLDAAAVEAMANAEPVENQIQLTSKIPVHITYFTSWIADDGSEQRFKDVYGHEKRLMLALDGKFDQIVRGPDHLAPVAYPKIQVVQNPLEGLVNSIFGGF